MTSNFKICKKCKKLIVRENYEKVFVKRTRFSVLTDVFWSAVRYHNKCSPRAIKKRCPQCNKEFQSADSEAIYCSRSCRSKYNYKFIAEALREGTKKGRFDEKNITKICQYCGNTYYRKRYSNGKLLVTRDWNKQKFCSNECRIKVWDRRKR